jgi:hypothetical protein
MPSEQHAILQRLVTKNALDAGRKLDDAAAGIVALKGVVNYRLGSLGWGFDSFCGGGAFGTFFERRAKAASDSLHSMAQSVSRNF